jgi:hypothetical protein
MSDLKRLADSLGSRVAALEARAESNLRLLREVRTALPETLANQIVSASYRDETLVVLATSGAWCAQIRYAESALRKHFAARGLPVFVRLKVRVQAPPAGAAG